MDDFWAKIDYDQFEILAHDYAVFLAPDWNWKPTKKTRDGSRDGEATIIDIETPFGKKIIKEAWYEAKYQTKSHYAIPISKIAATVLVGHNNREYVELILIITNASFSINTMREVRKLLGDKVIFILGDELKSWLHKESQLYIREKYGLLKDNKHSSKLFYLLNRPVIVRTNTIYNTVSTTLTNLVIGQQYELHFIINLPFHNQKLKEIKLSIIKVADFLELKNDTNFKLSQGNNFICISFIPKREGSFYSPLFIIKNEKTNSLFEIKKQLLISSDNNLEILIQSQIECEISLNSTYNNFKQLKGFFLYSISGDAGSGKSRVLEKFIESKEDDIEYLYLKFKKDELTNSILMIQLLSFLVFGSIFLNAEFENEDIKQINSINQFNTYYSEYLVYLADENNALEYLNILLNRNRELIPYTNASNRKILILDDLQFLELRPSKLLLKILVELSSSNHNLFIACAKREVELRLIDLEQFISLYSSQKISQIKIQEEDVIEQFKQYNLQYIPHEILLKIKRNLFIFKKITSIISHEENPNIIEILQKKVVKRVLRDVNSVFVDEYSQLSKEEKKVTELIYFFEKGVKSSYLLNNFSENIINTLLDKGIIKYNYATKEYIPFHDIYMEQFASILSKKNRRLYKYAEYQKVRGNNIEYLSVLIYFPTKVIRHRDFLFSHIKNLYQEQKYFNIYYVLHRFFSVNKGEQLLGSSYHNALLLYYYAYATFNVGENNGRDIFQKAYLIISHCSDSKKEALKMAILAEIANCDYWNLNFKSVEEKYLLIYDNLQFKQEKSEFELHAISTIICRYVNIKFLQDQNEKAIKAFTLANKIITTEKKEKQFLDLILGYCVFNFDNDAHKLFLKLKLLVENTKNIPIKTEFKLKTQLYKMGNILGLMDIQLLIDIIKKGSDENLNYSSKNATLRLGICYALLEDYKKLDSTLDKVIDIRDYPLMTKGIYYNLKSLTSLIKFNYSDAKKYLDLQFECHHNLGESFKRKILSNQKFVGIRPAKIKTNYLFNKGIKVFYIESRF